MTKIRVSKTSGKMYSHAYRFTNSTTANFSYVQPLCCRFVFPKGSIKGSLKQFMRLSAMPRPTFGDITMNNVCSFVPIEDIYPAFSSLMSELPYTTASGGSVVPKSMPYITPAVLNKILTTSNTNFHSCDATVYNISAGTNPDVRSKASEFAEPSSVESIESIDIMPYTEYKEKFYNSYISDQTPCISSGTDEVCVYDAFMSKVFKAVEASKLTDEDAERAYLHHFYDIDKPSVSRASNVTDVNAFMKFKDSYDYFVVNYTDTNTHTLTCYRFTDLGKQLRKIFIGLGYTYSRDDSTHLNVLPLIACYKAFYDRFIPARDIPFSATAAFGLIQFIEQSPSTTQIDFVINLADGGVNNISAHFTKFVVNCLANMYSTQDVNFYSLHMRSLDNGFGASVPTTYPNSDLVFQADFKTSETKPSQLGGGYTFSENGLVNAVSLRLLQKMYGYLGRNSLIGNRIEQWAKLHLDSDVYNNLFKKSSVISSNSFHVQIGDIDATAGTRSETTTDGETIVSGNVLGDYAGKGIGSGELTFKASFNTYGYFIVLSWIDPQTSMYQGTDAQLCALTKYEVPQAEFDALGYELTPRSCVWTDNDISLQGDKQASSTTADVTIDNNKSFGYVPRYSGFKYAKNIVNGDFSLNSLQNSMESYYLDRKLTSRQLNVKYNKLSPEKTAVFVTNSFIPQASEQWRYIQRYDWLSNYNRIFVNSSAFKYYPFLSGVVLPGNLLTDYQWPMDDNFYIHCVFDITENTPLKPLSQSYDTQVKSNDGTTIVNPA